jgi:transposase
MEAGGGAHYCHRVIGELGHELRLMPRAYVKPFVKRQMNNAACTEAISEVAMRFVPVK